MWWIGALNCWGHFGLNFFYSFSTIIRSIHPISVAVHYVTDVATRNENCWSLWVIQTEWKKYAILWWLQSRSFSSFSSSRKDHKIERRRWWVEGTHEITRFLCISQQTFLNLNSDELGWLWLTDNYVWSALGLLWGKFYFVKKAFFEKVLKS